MIKRKFNNLVGNQNLKTRENHYMAWDNEASAKGEEFKVTDKSHRAFFNYFAKLVERRGLEEKLYATYWYDYVPCFPVYTPDPEVAKSIEAASKGRIRMSKSSC